MVADFAPQNAIKYSGKACSKTMVLFFKLTANLQANQLPDLETAFGKFPLDLQQQHFFFHKLIFAGAYQKR